MGVCQPVSKEGKVSKTPGSLILQVLDTLMPRPELGHAHWATSAGNEPVCNMLRSMFAHTVSRKGLLRFKHVVTITTLPSFCDG